MEKIILKVKMDIKQIHMVVHTFQYVYSAKVYKNWPSVVAILVAFQIRNESDRFVTGSIIDK